MHEHSRVLDDHAPNERRKSRVSLDVADRVRELSDLGRTSDFETRGAHDQHTSTSVPMPHV